MNGIFHDRFSRLVHIYQLTARQYGEVVPHQRQTNYPYCPWYGTEIRSRRKNDYGQGVYFPVIPWL